MTTRNHKLDNAKAFAIFVVVLAHVLRDGRYFAYFVPAAVPVFFLLSGVTYHHNTSFLSFLRKKTITIIIPYLFAGIVSIFIYAFLGKFASKALGEDISTTTILPNVLNLLYGSGKHDHMKWNNSLWFLPCLMIVMLLVYIIESIVSIVRQNRFHRLILRLTSSLVCLIIGLYFTTHFKNVALPWHIETALCNVIFVEIGIIISPMVLTTYKEQKSTTLQNTILLIVFMAAAMSFAFLNGETSARTDEYGINYILYFLSSVCFSLAYLYAGSLIGDKIHAISYTGKNTLPILLWNKFPIILLQTIIGKFTLVLTKPDTALALIVAIIPALISISLCLLAGAIQKKILPITLGITKKH